PHLAEQVVIESEETRMRDAWGHQQLREGTYTPGEIDREWTPEMTAEFEVWRQQQTADDP
ncbi:MAG: RraA family protein, partial [Gemmatimonadota bacterium]|nr:RraA family protein [Gemmatimonadota bacterium]